LQLGHVTLPCQANAHAENYQSLDRCEKFATAELRVLFCIEQPDRFYLRGAEGGTYGEGA
jgi:hypothetical protein